MEYYLLQFILNILPILNESNQALSSTVSNGNKPRLAFIIVSSSKSKQHLTFGSNGYSSGCTACLQYGGIHLKTI